MPLTLSLHTGHDANMTIADPKTGKTVCYVEFEKVANRRYFKFKKDQKRFADEFQLMAWPFIERHAARISRVNLCWVEPEQAQVIRALLPSAEIDDSKRHHLLHAYSVYAFAKPKAGDLIISYDGGGDDDDYFWISHDSLQHPVSIRLS